MIAVRELVVRNEGTTNIAFGPFTVLIEGTHIHLSHRLGLREVLDAPPN